MRAKRNHLEFYTLNAANGTCTCFYVRGDCINYFVVLEGALENLTLMLSEAASSAED